MDLLPKILKELKIYLGEKPIYPFQKNFRYNIAI